MKTRVVFAWCLAALVVPFSSLNAKNAIYKGKFTNIDVGTGEVSGSAVYIVFGNETPVSPPEDRYTYLNSATILLGGRLGKKNFLVLEVDRRFRSIETVERIGKKARIVETISQLGDADSTDSANPQHSFSAIVLTGKHTTLRYDYPLTLKGYGLSSFGGPQAGGAPIGSASRTTVRLQLIRSLVDPIPEVEPLEVTIERLKNYLLLRGYTNIAP